MSVLEQIKQKLDQAGVEYTCEHHEPTITSQDAARIRGVELKTGAKALIIRGNKNKEHVLCVLPADLRLSSSKVEKIIGEKFSFASDPATVSGCVRGSVPPFGSVIGLKTYCDARLQENEFINFNAGSLTDSIRMRCVDYIALEQPTIVDCTEEAIPVISS